MYTITYMYMYVRAYVYVRTCMVCMVCMYVCMYVCIYTCIYTKFQVVLMPFLVSLGESQITCCGCFPQEVSEHGPVSLLLTRQT